MKLLVNARVYSFEPPRSGMVAHTALLIDGGRIVGLDTEPVGIGVERIDCGGATVLPAFADCHVHLTDTGYFLGPRDLRDARTQAGFAAAVAAVPNDDGIVLAGGYDDGRWDDGERADPRTLERVHPGARAMLVRVDAHSCIVNAATLAWLDLPAATAGIERDAHHEPTGRLVLDANWLAQQRFMEALPQAARRAAERRAVALALGRGALHLHAQLVGFPRERYAAEVAALRALPAKIHPKICEPDAALARDLGLPYVGGDVFLDGSIGSRTAAFAQPYCDAPTQRGELRFADDALLTYFAQAEALGIAAGVHAIGDAAVEQAVRVWERVLGGKPSPRGTRHFIEHFECASAAHVEACAQMGLALSMQPQFDACWGGEGGMYAVRLGGARMRAMNALAAIDAASVLLCGGADSPVCALDPLAGMQAAHDHHQPDARLAPARALAMYTLNAARFGYAEGSTGNLAPGLAADLVFLDGDPLTGDRFDACSVRETWREGECLYRRGEGLLNS